MGDMEDNQFWCKMYANAEAVPASDIRKYFEERRFVAGLDFPLALFWP